MLGRRPANPRICKVFMTVPFNCLHVPVPWLQRAKELHPDAAPQTRDANGPAFVRLLAAYKVGNRRQPMPHPLSAAPAAHLPSLLGFCAPACTGLALLPLRLCNRRLSHVEVPRASGAAIRADHDDPRPS